jgi:hypothetical protein
MRNIGSKAEDYVEFSLPSYTCTQEEWNLIQQRDINFRKICRLEKLINIFLYEGVYILSRKRSFKKELQMNQ